jgi:cytochrome b561
VAFRSTLKQWGTASRWLHWAFAVGLAVMVGLGLWMTDLPTGLRKVRYYSLHKSIGLTLLALVVIRLLWRLAERRPELPPMRLWQRRAAELVHFCLYALMFLIPLSGWLYNSLAGFPLQWFHLLNLPSLHAADPALKPIARDLHETLAWVLVALVAGHAAAALKHHFVDRDWTLHLMLPWLRPRDAADRIGDRTP